MRIVEPSAELLECTPNAAELIECAGHVCYKSEEPIGNNTAEPFVRKLLDLGHESVLEHASATMLFVCDRGVTHELVRHRLASYSQESTTYCNYGGTGIAVVRPWWFARYAKDPRNSERLQVWEYACKLAEETYQKLYALGAPTEVARAVLPTCLKTEIVMTANLREWRHVLRLRLSLKAHPDMRHLMVLAYSHLRLVCPPAFEDLKVTWESAMKSLGIGS
jgi:thymidylate synthase (FAD)